MTRYSEMALVLSVIGASPARSFDDETLTPKARAAHPVPSPRRRFDIVGVMVDRVVDRETKGIAWPVARRVCR